MINIYREDGFDIRTLSYENYKKIANYNVSNANRSFTAVLLDGVNDEDEKNIINELNIIPSPFALTNDYDYDIIYKDFRLFNIQPVYEYNDDYTIKSANYYDKDNNLTVTEDFIYIFDKETNEIIKINKEISWYRLDGRIGAKKVLNREYNYIIEKEEKTSEIRKQKIKRVKSDLYNQDIRNKESIITLNDEIEDYIKFGKKDGLTLDVSILDKL